MEMPGIEPGAFHMRSERSTTELHPQLPEVAYIIVEYSTEPPPCLAPPTMAACSSPVGYVPKHRRPWRLIPHVLQ